MTKRKKRIIPLNVTVDGCAYAIKASYFKNASLTTLTGGGAHYPCSGILEVYEYEEDGSWPVPCPGREGCDSQTEVQSVG